MHLVVTCLCVILSVLLVLDATPCSMEKRREMLIKVCGHYRRKRLADDFPYQRSKRSSHRFQNNFGETRHHKHYRIVADDNTGGILIRRKRGNLENYVYCCLDSGNCTFIC